MKESLISKPRARVMWSAEDRAEWLRLFNQSGQSAAEFSRDNDLSPATLSFWRQQVSGNDAAGPTPENAWLEIPQAEPVLAPLEPSALSAPRASTVSVTLPSGLRFEVPVGTDTLWLGQLLQALVNTGV